MPCVIFLMFCCINASVVTVYELISVKSTQTKAPLWSKYKQIASYD